MNGKLKVCIVAASFLLASVATSAQEVVHALTGTVSSIDARSKTITVFTDNQSDGYFQDLTNPDAAAKIDKSIRAFAPPVDAAKIQGSYVIVFYFGGDNGRTAVGLRSLGTGPFSRSIGIVVKAESKSSISIADESGAVKSFKLTPNTVAETGTGAVIGFKYLPHKGDKVSVISAVVDGNETALMVNTLLAN
jgi:hypothetical protein